jgi:ribosomal-protein-alanine N-acetyltransferase
MYIPSKNIRLEISNFVLRFPSTEDIPFIFAATRVKGFNDGMGWDPPEEVSSLHDALKRNIKAWEEGGGFAFTIESSDSKAFLGRISIRKTKQERVWNIGFFTHPDHQGNGIMKLAVNRILQFGFVTLKAIRIEADYAIWNVASKRVLESNGMQFAAYIEKGLFKNGVWVAEHKVAIDFKEWSQCG